MSLAQFVRKQDKNLILTVLERVIFLRHWQIPRFLTTLIELIDQMPPNAFAVPVLLIAPLLAVIFYLLAAKYDTGPVFGLIVVSTLLSVSFLPLTLTFFDLNPGLKPYRAKCPALCLGSVLCSVP